MRREAGSRDMCAFRATPAPMTDEVRNLCERIGLRADQAEEAMRDWGTCPSRPVFVATPYSTDVREEDRIYTCRSCLAGAVEEIMVRYQAAAVVRRVVR